MYKFLKQCLLVCGFLFVLGGQANAAGKLPPLEEGWARVFIEFHPGPGTVNLNDQQLTVGEREYLVVDLLPGNYKTYWVPNDSPKHYPETSTMTLSEGDVRFFSARIRQAQINYAVGVGGAIGGAIVGALEAASNQDRDKAAQGYDFISSVSELSKTAQQSPAKLNLMYSRYSYTKLGKDGGSSASTASSQK